MACVVLIPVAIAILGVLAAIAIPNFVRARRPAPEIHQQSDAMRREGLIARWSAEGTARDSMGHNDGVLMGNATFSRGLTGQAFKFDGNGSYVKIPRSPGLEMNEGERVRWYLFGLRNRDCQWFCAGTKRRRVLHQHR